ncbi:MAG: nucleotide exchange factor GrpE [Candidatus Omnitrophota bacterium]
MNNNKEEDKQVPENQSKVVDAKVTISKLEYEKLKEADAKKNEYWDRLLRQQADFENLKKRLEREKNEFIKYANENLLVEFLTVLDDLERLVSLAEKHKQDFDSFLKGVEMILSHLYELLKKYGIKAIDTENKKFDPNFHEALMTVESDTIDDNKIVEEFQKGYLMNGRLIRTAKVKVAKKKSEQ